MATKKVNLIIALKDGVSSGLTGIQGGLQKTGVSFRRMGVIALAATTAIAGAFTGLLKAWAQQETANNKLGATFRAMGEDADEAVKKWGDFATSVQRVTTLGDEQIMHLVSLGKTMGITNDKLEEATKGAIGLSKAFGIDVTSAMKMTALAMQGEYTMLQRYIPELRKATTDAEKHAIVQRAMASGFKIAQDEVNTLAGAWKQLKDVIGDGFQALGEGLAGDGGLVSLIHKLKDSIIELTEAGGGLQRWATDFGQGSKVIASTNNTRALNRREQQEESQALEQANLEVYGRAHAGAFWEMIDADKKNRRDALKDQIHLELVKTRVAKANQKDLLNEKKELELDIVAEVGEAEKEVAKEVAQIKQQTGGFADLYKQMYSQGSDEFERQQFTSFVAGQERAGLDAGVAGAGRYSAELRAGGMSEFEVIQRVQEFIKAEIAGMDAGLAGVGEFAKQLLEQGKDSFEVAQAVSGVVSAERLGNALTDGGLSDPMDKTNELLEEQNKILEAKLGGVL